jgi:4-amino-4-deoxy-L-arabinose transferase-like glycosyltransferase
MIIADLKNFFYDNRYLWLILLLGLLARLYAFSHTYVINPDGVYYLYQAKALLYKMPDKASSCGFPFISLYPVLIMLFYKIFGDWIVAAKSVSLFFGLLTVIPFYFLMKRFFTITVASITTLIFSLNPVLVERSPDLIKGPIFWFFSVLGLLLFVKALDRHKGR